MRGWCPHRLTVKRATVWWDVSWKAEILCFMFSHVFTLPRLHACVWKKMCSPGSSKKPSAVFLPVSPDSPACLSPKIAFIVYTCLIDRYPKKRTYWYRHFMHTRPQHPGGRCPMGTAQTAKERFAFAVRKPIQTGRGCFDQQFGVANRNLLRKFRIDVCLVWAGIFSWMVLLGVICLVGEIWQLGEELKG